MKADSLADQTPSDRGPVERRRVPAPLKQAGKSLTGCSTNQLLDAYKLHAEYIAVKT